MQSNQVISSEDTAVTSPQTEPPPARELLPGGTVVWIVFALEMGTFALFFLGFAWLSRSEGEVFRIAQRQLHPALGTLNTLILLTGSWMIARAVHAARAGKATKYWLLLTGLSGLVFMGIKSYEYVHLFQAGITLSTNHLWFYYLFLTLLHNLHVALGVFFCFYPAWKLPAKVLSEDQQNTLSASAIYWHLVDLIWVILFPLIYFARSW